MLSKPTTTLSGPLNTVARYFWAQLRFRLEELLKMIAEQNGCRLLAARVHDDGHVHVFVSAPPKVAIPVIVRLFKCIFAKVLFEEFAEIKVQLWGGSLWSEGYTVRTAGDVTGAKIEEYINRK